MSVAPLAVTVQRESVMDFTEAYFMEYQTVLVRYKNPEAEKWRLYLEPFEVCFHSYHSQSESVCSRKYL